jgi:hypothetical protein
MKRFGSILLGAMLAMCMTGIHGCSSNPPSPTGVTILVTGAVAAHIQHGTQDAATWARRASLILDAAKQLQSVEQGTVATLPGLTQALGPIIEKAGLSPGERQAANAFTLVLAQLIEANRRPGSTEEASIRLVLQTVVNAASVYLPVATTAARMDPAWEDPASRHVPALRRPLSEDCNSCDRANWAEI